MHFKVMFVLVLQVVQLYHNGKSIKHNYGKPFGETGTLLTMKLIYYCSRFFSKVPPRDNEPRKN